MNRIMNKKWIAVLAALALVAGPLVAQQQPVTQEQAAKGERLNRAPISKEILKVKLPRPVEKTLSNGLTVLIMEDHRFPLVSMAFSISGAGPIYEPAESPGLAAATATMLREGTKTRSSRQIAEEIDNLGATINAGAGWGSTATQFSANGLSDNFDAWFALALDVLLNPTFPEEELARLKQRSKVQLKQQRASPAFLRTERVSKAVFGSHPASVRSATEASIDATTPAMLAKWHAERYVPQNAILGIAGDVNATETFAKLEKWLEGWKRTALEEKLPADPKPTSARKIYLVNRPGSAQTDLALANLSIDRTDPDFYALEVMDQIVGSGSASRLFKNLREAKGYTYGAYSNFTAVKYPGPWQASSQVRTEVTEGAMTEFLHEIKRIREEAVPAQELEEQKRLIVAQFALGLEQPTTALNQAIIREIYGFPEDYWDTYPAKIMAITAADVQRVAKKYLNPETLQIVAVGDVEKIKAVMEKYGPVEIYDAEGKMVEQAAAATGSSR
ncbi:MAG: M16 family metallopeptidase [Candidatus Acidiferrales bacterium]